MQVYELVPDIENYRRLTNEKKEDRATMLEEFKGKPMRETWQPIDICIYKDLASGYDGAEQSSPDFTRIASAFVFSNRVVQALGDILEANGEILPLIYKSKEDLQYVAYNVTTFIDALDETTSKLKRFSNGKIMVINEYEFDMEKLEGTTIFRIPQELRIYVTDDFMRRVEEAELTGFNPRLLWTSQPENQLVAA